MDNHNDKSWFIFEEVGLAFMIFGVIALPVKVF